MEIPPRQFISCSLSTETNKNKKKSPPKPHKNWHQCRSTQGDGRDFQGEVTGGKRIAYNSHFLGCEHLKSDTMKEISFSPAAFLRVGQRPPTQAHIQVPAVNCVCACTCVCTCACMCARTCRHRVETFSGGTPLEISDLVALGQDLGGNVFLTSSPGDSYGEYGLRNRAIWQFPT